MPTLFFTWERSIPFVPWMIVPYMSIDLFFFAAPFLCSKLSGSLRHSLKRIVASLLVGGALFPAFSRFTTPFSRPAVVRMAGRILSNGFAESINPTISFRLFTSPCAQSSAIHYARRTRGYFATSLKSLVSPDRFSAVLTYQHHVLDVVAGFALGAYVSTFFQNRRSLCPSSRTVASVFTTRLVPAR